LERSVPIHARDLRLKRVTIVPEIFLVAPINVEGNIVKLLQEFSKNLVVQSVSQW